MLEMKHGGGGEMGMIGGSEGAEARDAPFSSVFAVFLCPLAQGGVVTERDT